MGESREEGSRQRRQKGLGTRRRGKYRVIPHCGQSQASQPPAFALACRAQGKAKGREGIEGKGRDTQIDR